jgi:hypothetical protein
MTALSGVQAVDSPPSEFGHVPYADYLHRLRLHTV